MDRDEKKEESQTDDVSKVNGTTSPEEAPVPDSAQPLLRPDGEQPIDDRFYEGKWWQRGSFNRMGDALARNSTGWLCFM